MLKAVFGSDQTPKDSGVSMKDPAAVKALMMGLATARR